MTESLIAKKLRIKPGQTILIISPPDGFMTLLGELPENDISTAFNGVFDITIAFYTEKSQIDKDKILDQRSDF